MMRPRPNHQRPRHAGIDFEGDEPKWFNSPVSFYEGSLESIGDYLPQFERRPFALTQPGNESSRMNQRLDMIVRKPCGNDQAYVPIGVVSKGYTLVPHQSVVAVAERALEEAEVTPGEVKAELCITEYGERMALSLYLPERFAFDPGDGHPLTMRLECFNSVDGSTRFRALMGWYRFVCCNGMIIGVTQTEVKRRHIGEMGLNDVEAVLGHGLQEADTEKQNFQKWQQKKVTPDDLTPWINKELKDAWGFKAAARFNHIVRTGHDAEIAGSYKKTTPTTISVRLSAAVPGAPPECRNLYDVSQALAWLAKERRDVQEQLALREAIHGLLAPLIH